MPPPKPASGGLGDPEEYSVAAMAAAAGTGAAAAAAAAAEGAPAFHRGDSGSQSQFDGFYPSRENEIEQAEFETRIRRYILELMQPTIKRTTHLENQQAELHAMVGKMQTKVTELSRMATKVEQQVALVETFREEMGSWDVERRQFQTDAQENLAAMRGDLDSFRYQLERQDASIHSVQRTVDRIQSELARAQENTEVLRQHVETRFAQNTRLLNTTKAELEVKLVGLETRFNRCNDELWGEETGLAKVISDLRNTDRIVNQLGEDVKNMQYSKATVMQLEAVQTEVNSLMGEANSTIGVLKRSVDTNLSDLKAHFKTATNTVAAHNAQLLSEVRQSYQEELQQSAKTRNEIMDFMKAAQEDVRRIEETLQQSNKRTEAAMKQIESEVANTVAARKHDKNNTEVETTSMRAQLEHIQATNKDVVKSLEHLSSVIWMVVQSENAGSALDIQDDSDRGRVALMGFRESKAEPGAVQKARPRSGASGRKRGEEDASHGGPVISVDQRCLSCSGHAQTVLSGFKMACLQYAPGPVSFAKRNWDRGELLDWRNKLLSQANEALTSGPIDFMKSGGERLGAAAAAVAGGKSQQQQQQQQALRSAVAAAAAAALPGGGAEENVALIVRPDSRNSSHSGKSVRSGGVIKMPPVDKRALTAR